jgi:hypothetical protein
MQGTQKPVISLVKCCWLCNYLETVFNTESIDQIWIKIKSIIRLEDLEERQKQVSPSIPGWFLNCESGKKSRTFLKKEK